MSRTLSTIRFEAKLRKPAEAGGEAWSFLVMPPDASAKLPSRSMVSVEGRINGRSFRATLNPDGQGSHWLQVSRDLRETAGAAVGKLVTLELAPSTEEPEPEVPTDLEQTLDANPRAKALWAALTPVARRDWIQWITTARKPETRARRIESTPNRLLAGKRRVCCFDRSGIYSKSLSAPREARE